jgi:sugar phosphate isomerase/epimerase
MWGIGRFRRLQQFFSAAQQLGFHRFELNHQVDSQMLDGVDLNSLCIPSVHEPCPADISPAMLQARDWLISSTDGDCRRQGIRAVQRSIDLAQELGAGVVVVHPGRVDVDAKTDRALWDLYDAGQAHTSQYHERKERLVAARAAKVDANLAAVRQSLELLVEYASRAGIRLGLENRYHYLDIPLLDELEGLLALADEEQAGFLYDVGHAQTLENLGFSQHEEWLRRYAPRLVGVHLHDIRGLIDHYAAGLGQVDWDMVASYLPKEALRTCEFRGRNSPAQVLTGMQLLVDKGCIERL